MNHVFVFSRGQIWAQPTNSTSFLQLLKMARPVLKIATLFACTSVFQSTVNAAPTGGYPPINGDPYGQQNVGGSGLNPYGAQSQYGQPPVGTGNSFGAPPSVFGQPPSGASGMPPASPMSQYPGAFDNMSPSLYGGQQAPGSPYGVSGSPYGGQQGPGAPYDSQQVPGSHYGGPQIPGTPYGALQSPYGANQGYPGSQMGGQTASPYPASGSLYPGAQQGSPYPGSSSVQGFIAPVAGQAQQQPGLMSPTGNQFSGYPQNVPTSVGMSTGGHHLGHAQQFATGAGAVAAGAAA